MAGIALTETIYQFAHLTCSLPDQALEKEWVWGEYDEGVRFAFFRVYEELRQLAATLETLRTASNQPLTTAQRILGQYHTAFLDLCAILLGVDQPLARQIPGENEWALLDILHHIVGAERGFYAANLYGLEGKRRQDGRPLEMTEEAWDAFWNSDAYSDIKRSQSWGNLLQYYELLHQRVLESFQDINETELDIPIAFWEKECMPLRFRLHRFDSHLRQHTIQAQKALTAISGPPSEAMRLLRMIFAALAQVEDVLISGSVLAADLQDEVSTRIAGYTREISGILT
jgi:hypothetical protein